MQKRVSGEYQFLKAALNVGEAISCVLCKLITGRSSAVAGRLAKIINKGLSVSRVFFMQS